MWLLGLCLSDYWAIYLSIISGTAQILMTALATTNAVLIYGGKRGGVSVLATASYGYTPLLILMHDVIIPSQNWAIGARSPSLAVAAPIASF